jgi:iron complex transport system substrate-binding protein
MRIVSLLPSATEIVYALGLDGELVAVTDECDFPPRALEDKPVVSRTALPTDRQLSGAEIDVLVTELVGRGEPLYRLDAEAIRGLRPDLILAQDLCRVCAVPSGDVEDALATLGCRADVLSLDPSTLDDVIAGVEQVGAVTGRADAGASLAAELRARVEAVRRAVAARPRPRTLALEWRDPPFAGGHWVPDMVLAAGGEPVLGSVGRPSARVTWDDIAAADPEVAVFMPCGYGLDRTLAEADGLAAQLPVGCRVFAVDASSYFSRPSPRIVDGLETLAWALHPEAAPEPPPGRISRLP